MAQGFYSWFTTAGSNGSADATVNFQEGQAPSSLNDSARAMMARLREWGNDISGSIVTTGSLTAYAVATGQSFASLTALNGQIVAFTPHVTNGATVTLNCDGLGAKALRYGPSLELQSGMLIAGTPYVAIYSNADSAFYLRSFKADPYGVPLGGLMPYTGTTAPNSAFVLPFGQALSRATYATYFSLVGTTYGTGDGTTTFNILDLRGRFIAGLDNMGGSAASRITNAGSGIVGTTLGAAGGAETVTVAQANLPAATLATTITDPNHSHFVGVFNGVGSAGSAGIQGTAQANNTNTGSGQALSGATSITASTALGGSGTALNKMPPAMVLPYILRVI